MPGLFGKKLLLTIAPGLLANRIET